MNFHSYIAKVLHKLYNCTWMGRNCRRKRQKEKWNEEDMITAIQAVKVHVAQIITELQSILKFQKYVMKLCDVDS